MAQRSDSDEGWRLLAAPLIVDDRAIGLVCLESKDNRLDEERLEYVAAAATVGAWSVENARRRDVLERQNEALRREALGAVEIVGRSPAIEEVQKQIAKLSGSEAAILIVGEVGVGKELAARAMHARSERAGGPFLVVNCVSAETLWLERELARLAGRTITPMPGRRGLAELAEGGTLLLDEVSALSKPGQLMLLEILRGQESTRASGGGSPVRILASSRENLDARASGGRFNKELLTELAKLRLEVPALRRRREDIPVLATHFAEMHAARGIHPLEGVSPEAMETLLAYDWPGNVRELANTIERAAVLGEGPVVGIEDLPEEILQGGEEFDGYHGEVARFKISLILDALSQAQGSYARAAELLGINRTYLHRLIRNFGLKDEVAKIRERFDLS